MAVSRLDRRLVRQLLEKKEIAKSEPIPLSGTVLPSGKSHVD